MTRSTKIAPTEQLSDNQRRGADYHNMPWRGITLVTGGGGAQRRLPRTPAQEVCTLKGRNNILNLLKAVTYLSLQAVTPT